MTMPARQASGGPVREGKNADTLAAKTIPAAQVDVSWAIIPLLELFRLGQPESLGTSLRSDHLSITSSFPVAP